MRDRMWKKLSQRCITIAAWLGSGKNLRSPRMRQDDGSARSMTLSILKKENLIDSPLVRTLIHASSIS